MIFTRSSDNDGRDQQNVLIVIPATTGEISKFNSGQRGEGNGNGRVWLYLVHQLLLITGIQDDAQKIRQMSTVQVYQDLFEALLNKVELTEAYAISLFIRGLKEEIALLNDDAIVFDTPKELPPKRTHEHTIPLLPDTPPINIRPYKHPPNQKDVIELMVKEWLESGVIRNGQSLFSSPIVMVKKKDGTWRMCVNYRQLNKYTVKDKVQISVIEELLDELNGALNVFKTGFENTLSSN
ncbi:hypothetical protein Tco_0722912 [Tanacetum coccineum]